MIASALFYLGLLLLLLGLAALAMTLPRRTRGRRRRGPRLLVALAGAAVALVALALPAPDVVVTRPRHRLDAIVPRYQFHERHTLAVAAPPAAVDRAVRAVTADEIRFYRALTWIRRLGRGGRGGLLHPPRGVPMLAAATRGGFHLLADEPGREVVLGVAAPVSPSARERAATRGARRFVAAAEGHVSIAINFHVAADGRGGSVLTTETRVHAPDAATRRRFAIYWRLIYPGSALIRRGWLDAIRRRAEGTAP